MKIINSNETQMEALKSLFPERSISSYISLIPANEYYFWVRRFTTLFASLSPYLYPVSLKLAGKLPILQCVSKLININPDGFLLPKVFKFGTLPNGTFKDFGFSYQAVQLLDTIAGSLAPYEIMKFPQKEFKTSCLGFLAWDTLNLAKRNEQNLLNFMTCANSYRINEIKLLDKIEFDGKNYTHFLPTSNSYENKQFKKMLLELNERRMLALPLSFPLNDLKTLIGFTDPIWAEVKPLDFFLEEDPNNLSKYVLIRTDDGKIVTWGEVMASPKLRLEIEMSDYWLWQEACKPNDDSLANINMYWEFGMEYPYLIDKRDDSFIPAFIVV